MSVRSAAVDKFAVLDSILFKPPDVEKCGKSSSEFLARSMGKHYMRVIDANQPMSARKIKNHKVISNRSEALNLFPLKLFSSRRGRSRHSHILLQKVVFVVFGCNINDATTRYTDKIFPPDFDLL